MSLRDVTLREMAAWYRRHSHHVFMQYLRWAELPNKNHRWPTLTISHHKQSHMFMKFWSSLPVARFVARWKSGQNLQSVAKEKNKSQDIIVIDKPTATAQQNTYVWVCDKRTLAEYFTIFETWMFFLSTVNGPSIAEQGLCLSVRSLGHI